MRKLANEIKKELLNKEMNFMNLDNYMVKAGYYTVLDGMLEDKKLAKEIKKDGQIHYMAVDDTCLPDRVVIKFDVTFENVEEYGENYFSLKVTDVE